MITSRHWKLILMLMSLGIFFFVFNLNSILIDGPKNEKKRIDDMIQAKCVCMCVWKPSPWISWSFNLTNVTLFSVFFLFYFIDGLYGIIVGLKQCIDDDDDDDHDRDQYDNEQQLASSIIIVAESTWHQASKYFYSKSYFSIFRFFFVVHHFVLHQLFHLIFARMNTLPSSMCV